MNRCGLFESRKENRRFKTTKSGTPQIRRGCAVWRPHRIEPESVVRDEVIWGEFQCPLTTFQSARHSAQTSVEKRGATRPMGSPIGSFMTAGQVSQNTGAAARLGSLPKLDWLLTNRGYERRRVQIGSYTASQLNTTGAAMGSKSCRTPERLTARRHPIGQVAEGFSLGLCSAATVVPCPKRENKSVPDGTFKSD